MPAKCHVTFVGGPFDGHRQPLSIANDELSPVALLPVTRGAFRLLDGKPQRPDEPITSVAVYRLENWHEECRYQFIRSVDPAAARTVV